VVRPTSPGSARMAARGTRFRGWLRTITRKNKVNDAFRAGADGNRPASAGSAGPGSNLTETWPEPPLSEDGSSDVRRCRRSCGRGLELIRCEFENTDLAGVFLADKRFEGRRAEGRGRTNWGCPAGAVAGSRKKKNRGFLPPPPLWPSGTTSYKQ